MPELPDPRPQKSQERQARRSAILRRLRLVGPGPAGFYTDALEILGATKRFQASAHLVMHCLREVQSCIMGLLEALSTAPPVEEDDTERGKKRLFAAVEALGLPPGSTLAATWHSAARQLHKLAHRDSLAEPRQIDEEFDEAVESIESAWDEVLRIFERNYERYWRDLDAITAGPPTAALCKKLKNKLPNNQHARSYFFSKISDPGWVKPLRKEGFFEHPLGPFFDDQVGAMVYANWPALRFLESVVAAAVRDVQAEIVEIASRIKSENPFIVTDVLRIAAKVPADLGIKLHAFALSSVREFHSQSLIPFSIVEYADRLVASGFVKEGASLLRQLLSFVPLPPRKKGAERRSSYRIAPPTKITEWQYAEVLANSIVGVARQDGFLALEVLRELLEETIRVFGLETPEIYAAKGKKDRSHIWLPDLEQAESNDLSIVISKSLLSVADEFSRTSVPTAGKVLRWLVDRDGSVFKRVGLTLAAKHAPAVADQVEALVTRKDLFWDRVYWGEYSKLLKTCWASLSAGTRAKVLEWIRKSPTTPTEQNLAFGPRTKGEPRFVGVPGREKWVRDRLSVLKGQLPVEEERTLERLTKKHGVPRAPQDSGVRMISWVGPKSPKTTAELAALSIDQLLEYLSSWTPSQDDFSDSREGLARKLEEAVRANPARFAEAAGRFVGVHPVYAAAVLRGLELSLRSGVRFDWGPVITLCEWGNSTEVPRTPDPAMDSMEEDWQEVRRTTSQLLAEEFQNNHESLPEELEPRVWGIVSSLSRDPNPTPRQDSMYERTRDGYMNARLNLIRCRAMDSAVCLVWRASKRERGRDEGGGRKIPELAREVLRARLDPAIETAPTVRWSFGHYLPVLRSIDEGWVTENLERIFPKDAGSEVEWRAAWLGYLFGRYLYPELIELMASNYARAASLVGTWPDAKRSDESPDVQLGSHLLTMLQAGDIDLKSPMLKVFLEKSSDEVRASVLERCGAGPLANEDPGVTDVEFNRLKEYWLARFAEFKRSPQDHGKEVGAFSHWFIQDRVERKWAHEQLDALLAARVPLEELGNVLKKLKSESEWSRGIAVLEGMLDLDPNAPGHLWWQEGAHSLLEGATASEVVDLMRRVRETASRLVAAGHLDFRVHTT